MNFSRTEEMDVSPGLRRDGIRYDEQYDGEGTRSGEREQEQR